MTEFNHRKFAPIAILLMAVLSPVSAQADASGTASIFGADTASQLFSGDEISQFARIKKRSGNRQREFGASETVSRLPQTAKTGTVAALMAQPVQTFANLAAAAGIRTLKVAPVSPRSKLSSLSSLSKTMTPAPRENPVVPESQSTAAIVVNVEKKTGAGNKELQTAVLKIDALPAVPPSQTIAHIEPPQASVQTSSPKTLQVTVERRNGTLLVEPPSISLAARGTKAKISFKSDRSNEADFVKGLSIFVRDAQNLEWNAGTREIVAKSPGRTELYIVTNEKMHIVPVNVTGSAGGNWELQVPDTLVSLDGLVQKQTSAAIFPDQISESAPRSAAGDGPVLSVHESLADVSKTVRRVQADQGRFSRLAETLSYTKVVAQIVDERTRSRDGVYPVAGARLRIVGTEFSGESDSTGHIVINDVPQRARLMVAIDHPGGQYRSSVAEIRTLRSADSGVQRMKVSREFAFDANMRLAGVVQNAGLASVCGITVDTPEGSRPVAGIRVALDVSADGPYYFNRFGFLDRSLSATSETGRFCFFNADAGPALATFYAEESAVTTVPVTLFAGHHIEEDYVLALTTNYGVQLATTATAHEQLSSDIRRAASYQNVDFVELLPIGSDRAFAAADNGYVTSSDPLIPYRGRNLVLVRASEFESAVYVLDSSRASEPQVTPFLPRGFIEDMAVYAQVAHDPSLGSVFVEHGTLSGQGTETIRMRLLNENNFDVAEAWYYSDSPITRALFFNVPPGTYSLLIETANHFWLAADTVTVFSEAVSYVSSGASLRVKN